jgi:hypothetical protein
MAAETPDFTVQIESLELRKPLPIVSIRQHVRRKTGADASQAPTRRGDLRLQNLARALASWEVRPFSAATRMDEAAAPAEVEKTGICPCFPLSR